MCGETKNKKKTTINMVEGSLWKNIFLFSVPLMLSQLLEVMFNLSDVAVVGKFADYKALGAVGCFSGRTEIKNILQSDFRRRAGKYVQIRAEDGTIFIHLHWIKERKMDFYISLTGMMKP